MKVKCVESCEKDFVVGKLYEFVNGTITDDGNYTWHCDPYTTDISGLNNKMWQHCAKIARFELVSTDAIIADIERQQRELADQLAELRKPKPPTFTLEGFLAGEFSVEFANDFDKGCFLGWLQGVCDVKWVSGTQPVGFIPVHPRIECSCDGVFGLLHGDNDAIYPRLPYHKSMLTRGNQHE